MSVPQITEPELWISFNQSLYKKACIEIIQKLISATYVNDGDLNLCFSNCLGKCYNSRPQRGSDFQCVSYLNGSEHYCVSTIGFATV